ncbi:hypothetical protein [Fusobacterium canifelinum]|uniref:HrgC protein n=1 Tax=Fusobacterium canifelinum TaxID=285729 RepID=A0A3P1UN30_9FUSO|nr:hypothetical protein [Fusobacterium canifelinum]RRD22790.1 hypothetical protein EII27_09235 [Fusobacterium canifelinum]
MAIKVKLEKDGFIKDGFVGFSWTSIFFNLWVPAFRLHFDGFIIFFIIYLIETLLPIFILVNSIINYQNLKKIPILFYLQIISYIVTFFVGCWYNKYYTKKMLENGWKLLENDEYSAAVLKGYRYLDYTETEIADQDKMQRYAEFLVEVKSRERNKFFFFLLAIILIICLVVFF